MFNQWKYDFNYIFYSKKHRVLILLTILFSGFLVINTSSNDSGLTVDAYKQIFINFRQLFWIISVFVMTDLVSSDYHSKTLKNILYHSNSRMQYVISKIGIAVIFSIFLLLIHFLTVFTVLNLSASDKDLTFFEIHFFLLGAISGLILFASLLSLVMVVSENETITMGIAVGMTLLLLLVESTNLGYYHYLPTMQVTSLELTSKAHPFLSFSILIGYFAFAFLTILATIKIFNKKDIFI